MIRLSALVLAAVSFKLLGGQYFTPLSFVAAALLFFLRYAVAADLRRHLEGFLLQLGVLIYALANQDPSYYEHAALVFCLVPSMARLRGAGRLAVSEGTALLVLAYTAWSLAWTAHTGMSLAGLLMSAECLAFLLAFVVASDGELEAVLRQVLEVLAAVLVGSLLVGAMGHGSVGSTFAGVTWHRNHLGFLLGLLILLSVFRLRSDPRWLHGIGVAAGAAFLLYIDSKSAIIAIALTSLVWFIATARRWRLYAALAAAGLAAFYTTLPTPKMDHFALRMGRDPTFTSRTLIWADSARLLAEQPFTGFGYNAVWSAFENRLSQYPNAPGPRYAHAHNAWLDWGLQLGLGGLLLYLVFLAVLSLRAVAHARRGAGFAVGLQALCLLLYVQIYDLANVSTIPITRFGFFLLAATSACLWLGAAGAVRHGRTTS